METINKALSDNGLQMSDLSKKTQIMIADYQNTLRGIKLQSGKGKTPTKALEKAEVYRDAILEEIFIVAEEKNQATPPAEPTPQVTPIVEPTPPAEPTPPVETVVEPTPPAEPTPPSEPEPKKSTGFNLGFR